MPRRKGNPVHWPASEVRTVCGRMRRRLRIGTLDEVTCPACMSTERYQVALRAWEARHG